jgi:hypothetical protein
LWDAIGGYPIGVPQVQVFADVHRSADSMWRELGSFQGIARWHPMLKVAEGEGEEPGQVSLSHTVFGVSGAGIAVGGIDVTVSVEDGEESELVISEHPATETTDAATTAAMRTLHTVVQGMT